MSGKCAGSGCKNNEIREKHGLPYTVAAQESCVVVCIASGQKIFISNLSSFNTEIMRTVEGFRLRKMGSEYIIVGEGLGQVVFNKFIALIHSASYLWQRIEGKDFTPDMLASLLVERYGIEFSMALNDAEDIIRDWLQVKIIE